MLVTILKGGRAVARLIPPAQGEGKYPQDSLRGTVEILGDVMEPVLPAGAWEAEGVGATLLTQDSRIIKAFLVPTLT